MKSKKPLVCVLLAGSMLLSACGSNSSENTATTAVADSQSEPADQSSGQETSDQASDQKASDTVTGMIQSIEDNTITLAIRNAPNGEAPGGNPPAMPDGEAPNGSQPAMPDGEAETVTITVTDATTFLDASGNSITLDDLQENSMITVEIDGNKNAVLITLSDAAFGMGGSGMGGSGMGGFGNGQSAPTSYSASNHYTDNTDLSGETISSTGTDENAVLVTDGASVSLDQMTINRTSSDSSGGDASSFYGIGAAVLATDGTVKISNSTIKTDASGAAGVFAYADGIAYVSDSVITSQQDTSGGSFEE